MSMRQANTLKLMILKEHLIGKSRQCLIAHLVRRMHLLKSKLTFRTRSWKNIILCIQLISIKAEGTFYLLVSLIIDIYCVFTVSDKVVEFKGTILRPGLYYVESDNCIPLRSNG
jgi:hypothetical protein